VRHLIDAHCHRQGDHIVIPEVDFNLEPAGCLRLLRRVGGFQVLFSFSSPLQRSFLIAGEVF